MLFLCLLITLHNLKLCFLEAVCLVISTLFCFGFCLFFSKRFDYSDVGSQSISKKSLADF